MKKFVYIILSLVLLSGCGIKTNENVSSDKQGKMLYLEEKGKAMNFKGTDIDEFFNTIDYSKLEQSDITILQKAEYPADEDRTAVVYIDRKNHLFFVRDNRFTETYNNNCKIPENYIDLINKISGCNMNYSDGTINGQYDRLDFENDEYIICNPDKHSIFSLYYNNVYANINNFPVKIIAYMDNNKAVKLHIIGLKISYMENKLTDKNKESLINTLSALGVNSCDKLVTEFQNYIEDKKTSNKIGEYNINYCDNSLVSLYNIGDKRFKQMDMTVSLG